MDPIKPPIAPILTTPTAPHPEAPPTTPTSPVPATVLHSTGPVINPNLPELASTPAMLNAMGCLQVQSSVAPAISAVNLATGQKPPVLSQGAVAGYSSSGTGVWGQGNPAGYFVGNVTVTQTLTATDVVLPNADCAEEFDVSMFAEPGDVMVLDGDGAVRACAEAYDRKVAGVVSGAGQYKPAITLDRRPSSTSRLPIALVGKVMCKVDASYGAVAVGDLLTTSATPGHAMKAADPSRARSSAKRCVRSQRGGVSCRSWSHFSNSSSSALSQI